MDNLEFWDEIEGIGVLNMEMELVVGIEPVLFVCSLENNPDKKYLVMTYNSFKGKFVLREINNSDLLLMLNNEITMEETFRMADKIILTYLQDNALQFSEYKPDEFDRNMLPKKGAYYNIHSNYILNYIRELKTQKYTFNMDDKLYITDKIESIGENQIALFGNTSFVLKDLTINQPDFGRYCYQNEPYYDVSTNGNVA